MMIDLASFGLGCFLGWLAGGLVGLLWAGLCAAAKRGDRVMDEWERQLDEDAG